MSQSQKPRRRGVRARHALPAAFAVLLVASAAFAAVTITYNTPTTASVAVRSAPVVWSAGPDSSGNSFVASFALSSNATYYTITLKPVPEANVTWGNLSTLANQDSSAWTVTVTGTSVSSASKILDFRVDFYNYGTNTLAGTLDLRQASPSVNLGSFAAGAKLYTKTSIKLDTGTGAADLPASVNLSLTLS